MTSSAVSVERPALRITPTTLVIGNRRVGVGRCRRVCEAHGQRLGHHGSAGAGAPADVGSDDDGDDAPRRCTGRHAVRAHDPISSARRGGRCSWSAISPSGWSRACRPTHSCESSTTSPATTTRRCGGSRSGLAAAGVYQLSPLKAVCLRHCRSPIAQLLHYGNVKARLRDVRVSLHHAAYCRVDRAIHSVRRHEHLGHVGSRRHRRG